MATVAESHARNARRRVPSQRRLVGRTSAKVAAAATAPDAYSRIDSRTLFYAAKSHYTARTMSGRRAPRVEGIVEWSMK
jgi:hypothetical protein